MNAAQLRIGRLASWAVTGIVLVVLPFLLSPYWTGRVTSWLPLVAAVVGLNLLTGYNGQISVGHVALYGVGAYTTVILISDHQWPFLAAVAGSAAVCFVVGLLIGLPALRIKGLHLALVTLALAVLFPSFMLRFSWISDGRVTSPRLVYGRLQQRPVQFLSPSWWSALAPERWKYFFFLGVVAVAFVVTRNLIDSRIGRSMVAIRDTEVAAAVSGVEVARVKVLTFGVSAALAGVGGSLLALDAGQVSPTNFLLPISLSFLVMMVIGGAGSVAGPLVGVAVYNIANDRLDKVLEHHATWKPSIPLIFGASLVLLMVVAPGGLVGLTRRIGARLAARNAGSSIPVPDAPSNVHNSQEDP